MSFIFICPHCGTESSIDDALKGTESECPACCETVVLEPATERVCPHCGEKIKIMAKVCRFCHQPVASQKDRLINSLKSGLAFVQSKVADGIEMAKKQIDSIRKTDKNATADAGVPSAVAETEENTKFFWFECPFCHKSIDAEKEWSGMEAECPECGNTIIIPMASSEKNRKIAEMQKGSDVKKKRKKKIILISVLVAVIVVLGIIYENKWKWEWERAKPIDVNVKVCPALSGSKGYLEVAEYMVFVDDKLVASKKTDAQSHTFRITCRRESVIKAEIHLKSEMLRSDRYNDRYIVSNAHASGDNFTIKCW